ncbi:MAG: DUF4145 domain-containing protein [Sedimenticola thiotaurini]|uniref:DUF4145 domain-containing protein n=1 Tax=Sedimenticola thiotaurini TaxID=1543721 RepID=A0A558D462_9GAMM|nr:MAG: DUF4145 domain-containing protein [Sedimenticola thiotaurini]
MSETPFTPPEFRKSAFHCPTCNAYANHLWSDGYAKYGSGGFSGLAGISFSWCSHCHNEGIWVGECLVYPESSQAPLPNTDLPDEIKADYMEASSIIGRSPRGSAALLRLCIQKLCGHLGESGKNINKDISELVKKGLNPKIQKSLDIVRVIGNEAVHPGVMDLKDKPETAIHLCHLVNIIADAMITQPKMIDSLYDELPEQKKEQITGRDGR